MKRFFVPLILFAAACSLSPTNSSGVATIQVYNNVSPNGVFVGDTIQLNATALDLLGNPVPIAISYSSSNPAVATVNSFGQVFAVGVGTSSIGIAAGGQAVHLTLTVDGNVTAKILVTPTNPAVALGSQFTLTAEVLTTLGNPGRGKSVAWSTADATKASVDQTGTVTGVATTAGVAICATAVDDANVKGCTTVTVQ